MEVGGGTAPQTANFGTIYVQVSGYLQIPAALLSGKNPGTKWIGALMGLSTSLDILEKRPLAPTEVLTPCLPARWTVAIPTTILRQVQSVPSQINTVHATCTFTTWWLIKQIHYSSLYTSDILQTLREIDEKWKCLGNKCWQPKSQRSYTVNRKFVSCFRSL
jgi:hypothetical protein